MNSALVGSRENEALFWLRSFQHESFLVLVGSMAVTGLCFHSWYISYLTGYSWRWNW